MRKSELETLVAEMAQRLAAIDASLRESATVQSLVSAPAPAPAPARPATQTPTVALGAHIPTRAERKAANKAAHAAERAAFLAAKQAEPKAPKAAGPSEEQKSDRTAASTLEGVLARIAESRKGAVLEGSDRWYNAAKLPGGHGQEPVYEGFSVGDAVRLTLNAANRVLAVDRTPAGIPTGKGSGAHKPAGKTSKATKALKGAASAAPAPTADVVITKVSKDGTRCLIRGMFGWQPMPTAAPAPAPAPEAPKHPNAKRAKEGFRADAAPAATSEDPCDLCEGPRHFKGSAEQVSQECAERQWVNMGHPAPTMTDMATMIPFMQWLATTSVATFAHTKAGIRWIGKPNVEQAPEPAPAPAPSVDLDAAKRKLAAPATGTPSPSVSPKSDGGSKKARGGVDYVAIATHPSATLAPGKYTGMLVKHMTTPGIFRFMNADNVGPKGVGVTVEIDARSEKLMNRVRKITENSRIEMLVGTGYSRTGERMPMVLDVRQLDDVEKVTNVHKGTDVRGGRPTGPSDSIVTDARKARQGARRMAQMQRDAERISAAASGR